MVEHCDASQTGQRVLSVAVMSQGLFAYCQEEKEGNGSALVNEIKASMCPFIMGDNITRVRLNNNRKEAEFIMQLW